MTLVTGWNLMRNPSLVALTQFLASAISYVLFALPERITGEDAVPSYVEAIYVVTHGLWALGIAHETDLVTFCVLEKVCGVGLIFMSVIFIDLKVMLCLYAGEATLMLWNQWHLVGVDRFSMVISYSFIVSHVFVLAVIVVVDHTMRSIIFAKVDASDASSLMLGFRQVLRGVCDGDLLLDKSSCSIVDDASCLERLLKSSKKLSKTNFLDLFLDSESRQRFLHFLSSQDDGTSAASSMPRGLRISLQGADGAVSIDVFQTKVPNQGATGTDYCLLASGLIVAIELYHFVFFFSVIHGAVGSTHLGAKCPRHWKRIRSQLKLLLRLRLKLHHRSTREFRHNPLNLKDMLEAQLLKWWNPTMNSLNSPCW